MKIKEETEERLRQNDMNVSIIRQPQIKTEGIITLTILNTLLSIFEFQQRLLLQSGRRA